MKENNHSIFVVFTGIIICFGRFLLSGILPLKSKDYAILVIMAIVNYVAMGIVLLFILSDAFNFCKESILKTGIDTEKKNKAKKRIKLFSCVCMILYLMFGIIYLLFLKSSDLNDIISIFALSVSIVSNDLAKLVGNYLRKFIFAII